MFSVYNFSGYFHKVHPLKNFISLTTVLTGCQWSTPFFIFQANSFSWTMQFKAKVAGESHPVANCKRPKSIAIFWSPWIWASFFYNVSSFNETIWILHAFRLITRCVNIGVASSWSFAATQDLKYPQFAPVWRSSSVGWPAMIYWGGRGLTSLPWVHLSPFLLTQFYDRANAQVDVKKFGTIFYPLIDYSLSILACTNTFFTSSLSQWLRKLS